MTRFSSVALASVICLGLTAKIQAAIITGVVPTADSEFDASSADDNLTNNSGISTADDPSATHAASDLGFGMWITDLGVTGNTNVTFDLGGTFDLSTVYLWNHNQSNTSFTSAADLRFRGVNQFDVLVSSDGLLFTEVLTDQTLAITPSTGTNPLPINSESFSLLEAGVTHVRIHIDTNHGDLNVVGLSEVMFDGTAAAAVPEPESLALFSTLGVATLLGFGWRRRRASCC